MRKTFTVALMVAMVFGTAAFAATPVVSSLDDLSAYGTWIAQGDNGRTTKTDTVTSADFTLVEGFVAQYYAGGETKNIAKTGGDRTIPSGAAASVYDERSTTVEPEPETPAEINEIPAEKLATAADVVALFGGTIGSDGQVLTKVPAYTSFVIHDAWALVNVPDASDLNKILTKYTGETVVTGAVALDATFWPDPNYGKEPEAAPEIAVIPADSLITAEDVIKTFGGEKGTNGEVVTTIPSYTRFEVYESWIGVSRWDGSQAKAGDSVETAADSKPVTFWPDPDWKAGSNKKAAADTGNGGGGGGGCDAGFGAVAFVLLPLLYLKKGRK